jgi:hypothetical protein
MNKQYQIIKGAIEADNNKFILPQFGLKNIHYKCFDKTCKFPIIKVASYVKQNGTKVFDYFRHINLTDEEECKCKRYSRNRKLSNLEIHKEGVMNLNYVLENNEIDKRLVRYCPCCLTDKLINKEVEILQENERLETEYSFNHNGRSLRADIARIRDGKIYQIYEIKHSHATREIDRPSDIEWYEIDAQDINKQLEQMENFDDREIILSCQRTNIICPSCNITKERIALEEEEALRIVREEEILRCNAKRKQIERERQREQEEEEKQAIDKQRREEQEIIDKQRREEQEIKNKQRREEQEIKNKQLTEAQVIIDKQRREAQLIKEKQRKEERKEECIMSNYDLTNEEDRKQFYIDERIRRNAFLIRKQREWELSKQTLSLHHNIQDT